jgi:hypothetical protein
MEDRRGPYRILVGGPERKRRLGRPRHVWEDNIEMDPQEVEWGMDSIDLAKDSDKRGAVVNAVMNFWSLQTAENFLSSRGPVSFSRRVFAA